MRILTTRYFRAWPFIGHREENKAAMTEKIKILSGPVVENLLDKACRQRCELEVEIPGLNKPQSSGIHEFFPNIKRLDIYLFGDTEANQAISEGVKVDVQFVLADRLFRFPAICVEAVGKVPSHHLQVPAMIQEIQRRYYFRIAPPNPQAATLRIRYEASELLAKAKVQVVNISGGGILFYDKHLPERPEVGAPLGLVLRLGGQVEYKIQGAVARTAKPPKKWQRGYQVGVKFENLDSQVEEIVVRTIMLWQRQQRRGRVSD